MATAGSSIGTVSVTITGDSSKLNSTINEGVRQAQAGGEKIANAFNAAAIRTATLQLSVDQLRQKYDNLAQSGVRTSSSQQQMEATASRLAIAESRLALANQQVAQSNEQVAESAEHVTHAMVSGQQATSGFIRLAEGSGGLRAVENFLAKTLGLGPALQAIFPIVGALAFVEIIGKMASEFVAFFQKSTGVTERLHGEFSKLSNEIDLTNDELRVGNDRLENELAKISGKPQNGIKQAIDESILAADQLIGKLDTALSKLEKYLKENQLTGFSGVIKAALTGEASTPKELTSEALAGKTGFGGPTKEIRDIQEKGRAGIAQQSAIAAATKDAAVKKAALDEANSIREGTLLLLEQKYTEQINIRAAAEAKATAAQAAHQLAIKRNEDPFADPRARVPVGVSQERNVELSGASASLLRKQLEEARFEFQKAGLEQAVSIARAGKETEEAQKKAAEEWVTEEERKLNIQKQLWDLGALQESQAYDKLAQLAATKFPGVINVQQQLQEKANQTYAEYVKQRAATSAKNFEDQRKTFDDQLKLVEENAKLAEQPAPKVEALAFAQRTVATSTEAGAVQAAKDHIVELSVEAQHEWQTNIDKVVKETEKSFDELRNVTSAQLSAMYADWINRLIIFGASQAVIDAAIAKRHASSLAAGETQFKTADILAKGTQSTNAANVAAEKTILQAQYESQITHTLEQQLNYKRELASLDAKILKDKVGQAQAELAAAEANLKNAGAGKPTDEANAKILEARQAVNAAELAVRNQQLTSEKQITEEIRQQSIQFQVQKGLLADIDNAANQFDDALARGVTTHKGLGKIGVDTVHGLEQSSIQTTTKAVTQPLLQNTLDPVLSKITKAIGDALGKLFGTVTQTATQTPLITSNTTLTSAITAGLIPALAANTAAVGTGGAAAGIGGGASAAGGIGAAASTADSVASTASLATAIAPIIGGAIGGVISGIFTLIGDAKIVTAIHGTTDAVNALRTSGFSSSANQGQTSSLNSANSSSSSTNSGSSNLSISGALGSIGGFLGLNSFTSNGVPVDVIRISAFSTLGSGVVGGLFSLLGFAGGGRPPVGVPSIIGERGKELFIPDVPGTIISNEQLNRANGSQSQYSSATNNFNTGTVGAMHFNIYGGANPRETMRQISKMAKTALPGFNPLNG